MMCNLCVEIHGRDTKDPIQCPKCGLLVGCFWHDKGIEHLNNCKGAPMKVNSLSKCHSAEVSTHSNPITLSNVYVCMKCGQECEVFDPASSQLDKEVQMKSAATKAITDLYQFNKYKPSPEFRAMVGFMRQFINEIYVHHKKQITNDEVVDLLNNAGIDGWIDKTPCIVHKGHTYIKYDDLRKDYEPKNG